MERDERRTCIAGEERGADLADRDSPSRLADGPPSKVAEEVPDVAGGFGPAVRVEVDQPWFTGSELHLVEAERPVAGDGRTGRVGKRTEAIDPFGKGRRTVRGDSLRGQEVSTERARVLLERPAHTGRAEAPVQAAKQPSPGAELRESARRVRRGGHPVPVVRPRVGPHHELPLGRDPHEGGDEGI